MRTFPIAALLLLTAGCATQLPDFEHFRPPPKAASPIVGADLTVLVAQLGADDPGVRDNASSELVRLGTDPVRQREAIEALRAGATVEDPHGAASGPSPK